MTREQLEARVEALEDVLSTLWLYTGWYRTTRELTTEQRELWADVLDARHRADDEHHGYVGTDMAMAPIERWWRDDAPVRRAPRTTTEP